jgi:hypothetical protein
MEKETIEEAAERNCESTMYPYKNRERLMFKKGAEWQAERMYSEEEVIKLFKKIIKYDAKWQQELKQEIENL